MGKIHIKGGSPLRLRFEDDNGTILKDLELVPTNPKAAWYYVETPAGDRIMANPRKGGGNCFKVTDDTAIRIDVEYEP